MEPKPSKNIFKALHQRIAAVKDKMREQQRTAHGARQSNAQAEAAREGFDRPAMNIPSTPRNNEVTHVLESNCRINTQTALRRRKSLPRLAQSAAQLGVRLRYLEIYTERIGSHPHAAPARSGVASQHERQRAGILEV
jgi:hypothetical protein